MSTDKKIYIKDITDFYVKTPENIRFVKTKYKGKLSFKPLNILEGVPFSIGDKDTDDCTR